MGTFTPFLNLFKPTEATDFVDVDTDLNANYDKIDTNASSANATLATHTADIAALETDVATLQTEVEQVFYKDAGENVNNSTVPQNDDDLQFAGEANARYLIQVVAFWNGTGGGDPSMDARARIEMPTDGIWTGGHIAPSTPLAGSANSLSSEMSILALIGENPASPTPLRNGINTQAALMVVYHFFVDMGPTAGTVAFAWAQNVAVAQNLQLARGSHMYVRKVA